VNGAESHRWSPARAGQVPVLPVDLAGIEGRAIKIAKHNKVACSVDVTPFDSFGNRKAICIRMLQGDVAAGYTALPKNWAWRFTGWNPSFMMRPKPAPKGTVQTFPLVAFPASSF